MIIVDSAKNSNISILLHPFGMQHIDYDYHAVFDNGMLNRQAAVDASVVCFFVTFAKDTGFM